MAVLQEFARCHCCGRKILLVCSVTMWVTEPDGTLKDLLTLCQDCLVFDSATDAMGTSTFGRPHQDDQNPCGEVEKTNGTLG